MFGLAFYLITVPYLVTLVVPCLRPTPGVSYSDISCTVALALDWYLLFALSGFGVAVLIFFIYRDSRRFKPTVLTAISLSLLVILLFHLYIPQVERQIYAAPILLDTVEPGPETP